MADEDKKKKKKQDIGVEVTTPTGHPPGYLNDPHYKEFMKRIYEGQLKRQGLKKT